MVEVRKRRRKINLEAARNYRERGMSYAEIGRNLRASPTGVYYALHPRRRKERRLGRQRSLFLSDEHWDLVGGWAAASRRSRAGMIQALIEEEQRFRETNQHIFAEGEGVGVRESVIPVVKQVEEE